MAGTSESRDRGTVLLGSHFLTLLANDWLRIGLYICVYDCLIIG